MLFDENISKLYDMNEIVFTKDQLINLEFSLEKEILETSLSGAYACTTLALCNTRKYHGLFIAQQPQIDNEYHILLSSLDETIIQNDFQFRLALHRYPNDTYFPKGHKYLESFELIKLPKWTYRLADIILTKELAFSQNNQRLLIKYKVKECEKKFKLQLNPLLAFRQRHSLSKVNSNTDTSFEEIENGISIRLYKEYDKLSLQFSENVRYIHSPDWYHNFEYTKEAERGYNSHEDLMMPGYFEAELGKGDELYFTASINEIDPKQIKELFKVEKKQREKLDSFESILRRAAKMFFVEKGDDIDILAGYPWFGRWSRDTFISLPGLCIGLNDMGLFKKALDTLISAMKGGLFPNLGFSGDCAYNSADAPMWFFWALQQYTDRIGDKKKVWKEYKWVMEKILNSYRYSEMDNIKMLENGLIYSGENAKSLTWMDAIVDGNPITQRKGMSVEINALWYNAIMFSLELAKDAKDKEFTREWRDLAEIIPENFKKTFWSKVFGYLADVVDGYNFDFSVRPNMIIATSLKYNCVSEKIRRLIIERVKKELLTPYGLRTLSPTHPEYKDRYFGSQEQRDRAYHQGTVWTWLLGHFVEGYLKIYGKDGLELANKIYKGFENEIMDYGIAQVAEVFDGNSPYKQGGSIAQAWSVAELIRIKYLIDSYQT